MSYLMLRVSIHDNVAGQTIGPSDISVGKLRR